ncbi:MAG: hypothetical protein ABW076_18415 [Candidatus Thiodiazotropha sp.]
MELDLLRSDDSNPHAVKLFADMRRADIRQSIQPVIRLEDSRVWGVIVDHGGSEALAEKMLARKAAMFHYLEETGRG